MYNFSWFWILSYIINFILIITIVCFQRRDPIVSIAWILCFIALPAIGPVIFLIFGLGLKRHTKNKYKQKFDMAAKSDVKLNKQLNHPNMQKTDSKYSDMINYFRLAAKSPYTEKNEIKVYTDAKEKYISVLNDIENAKKNINLLYFIVRDDIIGNKIIDALIKKAREGVEIRFLYDGFGSILTNPKIFKKLKREKNVHVAEFFPVRLFSFSKINHRNHRKIILIDGKIAYMGGMNLGDEYMGLGKPSPWRDTHIRIVGEAVFQVQKYFCFDWEFSTGENLSAKMKDFFSFKTDVENNLPVQIVAAGPDSKAEEIKFGMMKMINSAKKYIYIQTPYFVPDSSFLTAVKMAAESGVDVRIMIPGIPDKKYVYHTTLSYVEDLLNSGVRVYCYNGFIHSKTIVCDDDVTTIGTTNIDTRSFLLHFEINAFMYSREFALLNKSIFLNDIAKSKPLTQKDYDERKMNHPISYMLDGFFRLFSPIL